MWRYPYIVVNQVMTLINLLPSFNRHDRESDLGSFFLLTFPKKVREKSREFHNHKPQPFPDTKRKTKPTNLNKHKSNKRTKSTKISSLFPKRGNRNTKRIEKHKNKMTHGKTYNKSPRRINHKATRSKTNTGITALERSVVEQTTGGEGGGGGRGGGFKALLQACFSVSVLHCTLFIVKCRCVFPLLVPRRFFFLCFGKILIHYCSIS